MNIHAKVSLCPLKYYFMILALGLGLAPALTPGQSVTTIYSFTGTNGGYPVTGLALGPDGNLYGTTEDGGSDGYGTVFGVTTNGTLTMLVSFDGTNGLAPFAGLTLGPDGNFYGTTRNGDGGYGTVFRVTTNGTLTTLTTLVSLTNGFNPEAALTLGPDGNFYGSTYYNEIDDDGTLFRVTTNGVLTTLVEFTAADGAYPEAALTLGPDGNFYGSTAGGGSGDYVPGSDGYGTVFRVTTGGTLTTLVSFNDTNGADPEASLTLGSDGNFYGTTAFGGASAGQESTGFGTVFRVTTNGTLTTLVSFNGANGANPIGGLTLGPDGNLYGTTEYGGSGGDGTAFGVTTNGTLTTLVNFNGSNGANPWAGLTLGPDGKFYGTTQIGGNGGHGVVFRLSVPSSGIPSAYTVSVICSPTNAGTFAGAGSFSPGTVQTVTAATASAYNFVDWSLGGEVVGLSSNLTLTVSSNVSLVANFSGGAGSFMSLSYQNLDAPYGDGLIDPTGVSGGEIVGSNTVSYDPLITEGFLYTNSSFVQFQAPGNQWYTAPTGIDGSNIVGSYIFQYSAGAPYLPVDLTAGFLFNGTTYTTFTDPDAGANGLDGTWATGISGNTIVGYFVSNLFNHGFVYTNGTYTTLDEPNAIYNGSYGGHTWLTGISGSSIVGNFLDTNDLLHGFLLSGGIYKTLDAPSVNPSYGTRATGVSGEVVVGYYNDEFYKTHGFLYRGEVYAQLDAPASGGSGTYALGIWQNEIVGTYTDTNGTEHGFIAEEVFEPGCTVALTAMPSGGGTVSGPGTFALGTSQSVIATPNSGYLFEDWTENGAVVSSSSSYTFTLTSNVSLVANFISISPTNAPTNTVVLVTNGFGGITHAGWPKSMVAGKKYTVTATPKAKNIFVNWTGGTGGPYPVLSASASYTFTFEPNLVLEANFETNLFLAAQGAYYGLFAPVGEARRQTNSGGFNLNVTSAGSLSGDLYLGSAVPIVVNGKFAPDGTATVVSKRSGENTLTTTLTLGTSSQTIGGNVTDGSFVAQLIGFQSVFSAKNKAPLAGTYTLVIPGVTNPAEGPYGKSYGTVTVSSSGAISFAGSLADGTPVSRTSTISQDGTWPFYLPLYNGKGSFYSWNSFPNDVTNGTITFSTNGSWINETNSSKTAMYRPGFTNQQAALTGGRYVPANGLPGDLTVTLKGGNLPFVITNSVTITSSDTVVTNSVDDTNKLKLTINKTTGVISGTFVNPSNPKQTIKVNGVILQGQTNAQGYFVGTNQSGEFLLENQ
jgi:uncharacterized repeat protein (TIGR03803 family)